jgi:hypothetical protein
MLLNLPVFQGKNPPNRRIIMNRRIFAGVIGFVVAVSTAARGADVPVKTVVLYSSGVGYFEHLGNVDGNAQTELRFKTDQINDILKSLVLQDLGGGTISTVSYPSQDPLSKTLKSFQIDIAGNPTLGDLLNQLRGAHVTVSAQAEQINGTILGVEKKQVGQGDGGIVERYVLNIFGANGIRAVLLDDVRGIELTDDALNAELGKALAAVSQARDQDKKPVTLNFQGQGQRQVRIGYVIETPIWKTSYRLILGNGDEKSKLQGWAIIENQTDTDWTDIQLGLVSGRPISFIENLYQSLYVPRPVMQPKLYTSLRPQEYEEGRQNREGGRVGSAQRAKRDEAKMAEAPAPAMAAEADFNLQGGMDVASSVQSLASAAELGELFQYTIPNVSLARQQSAMIPIVTDDVEAERVSIYNPAVLANHPLNGAILKNITTKHWLQGPITVLDAGGYAGDARIEDVPPGQSRLLSYGVDLQMRISSANHKNESTILSGKIVKGVLYISRRFVASQDYVSENKSDKDKTLIIEHALRPGWKLVDTAEPMETTDALYRFKLPIAAGKTETFNVKEQQVASEAVAILPADISHIQFYATTGEIPAKVRDALAKAAELKQQLVDTQRRIEDRRQRINEITQEQNRIRENMRTVNQSSELYNRLMKKLDDQETQLETLQSEINTLEETLRKEQSELETYLNSMNVE